MRHDRSTQFDWKRRRRIIHITLIFCAVLVSLIAAMGADTDLNQTIVNAAFALATLVISSYVLGATWDDLNARKFGTPEPPAATLPVDDRAG
jgi:MFS-type transporter involved in bile tolerance (Atg22 family)